MQDVELWLRLMAVRRLNAKGAARIYHALQEDNDITPTRLATLALSAEQIAQFLRQDARILTETQRWLEDPLHHLIPCTHPAYPSLLHQITTTPRVLFVRGDPHVLMSPQLAIVGSRNHTPYGEQWGTYFALELALNGLTLTSGLALGIDGIAHRSALDAEGATVAVLGCGLHQVYPRQHRALAERIVMQGGAVISEFPLDEAPKAPHFPRRNRIISGLSLGVLVIEASRKSGSLVTARYALEQNRDVFALPGPLGNAMTEGTHWLIQQGAYLVAHPSDIIEQLGSGLSWLPSTENETISAQEAEVELPFADVLANVGDEVTPVDVVAERAGQPVPEIVGKLLDLELAGWIEAVPGGYVRLRRAGHVRRAHVFV